MTRYFIRRLHLSCHDDVSAELGETRRADTKLFMEQAIRHAWTLKVVARRAPISHQLLSAFTLRGLACWLTSAQSCYLFSNPGSLEEICASRTFITADEEAFAVELKYFLDLQNPDRYALGTHGHFLEVGRKTLVMGILNCTPDSFSDGGRYFERQAAIDHALRMAEDGADIIDVGGESTRPAGPYGDGAAPVSEAEEMERVIPVIAALARLTTARLSIDTYKSSVARAAIEAGASIVNDISGFQIDPQMAEVVAAHPVAAVLMHIKGTPRDMQQDPFYENVMDELYVYFAERLEKAAHAGISSDRIVLDPGLGFGKRMRDNYEILRRLEEFRGLGCPLMVGPSRKSFVGKVLDLPVDQRVEGTAAAVAQAIARGAHLVRVHDVREMCRVARMTDHLIGRPPESESQSRR